MGCVLLQDDSPVIFASRTLTAVEQHYSQIELEFLALVFTLNRLKVYIIDAAETEVQTGHLPILRLFDEPIHETTTMDDSSAVVRFSTDAHQRQR